MDLRVNIEDSGSGTNTLTNSISLSNSVGSTLNTTGRNNVIEPTSLVMNENVDRHPRDLSKTHFSCYNPSNDGFDHFKVDNASMLSDNQAAISCWNEFSQGGYLELNSHSQSSPVKFGVPSSAVLNDKDIRTLYDYKSHPHIALKDLDEKPIFCNSMTKRDVNYNCNVSKCSLPSTITLVISNIVVSFSTECHLDLKKIATEGCNVEYRREIGRLTMMIRKPCGFANIWASGKITCAGATSEADARILARRVARSIQKLGFNAKISNYEIVNIFSNCSLPFGVSLTQLYKCCKDYGFISMFQYEPELHPGATVKIKDLNVTMKVFATGSLTIIGPSVDSLKDALIKMYCVFNQCSRPVQN